MGKGSSGAAAQPTTVIYQTPEASNTSVTPAIAKSIAQSTEAATAAQIQQRQKLRGVASTYLRGQGLAGNNSNGAKTKRGQ